MKPQKQIMTIVSALISAFVLCSCAKPADKLVGTWSTPYDIVPMMESALGEDFEGFEAPVAAMYLTFEDDGTYRMYADREKMSAAIDEWEKAVSEYYVEKTYEQMKEQGYDRDQTEELFKKTYKCSCREYMDVIVSENINEDELIDLVSISGYYRADRNWLYFGNPEISANAYDLYTIKDNELILNAPDREAEEEGEAALSGDFQYPLVFTRVEE